MFLSRLTAAAIWVMLASQAEAIVGASDARRLAFEAEAFSLAYPVSHTNSFVFSPLGFELDCAIVGESLDTIGRAKIAETLGVLVDFGGVYPPLLERLENMTNRLNLVSARAFLVPDMAASEPVFRQLIQRDYDAAVCLSFPQKGAEAWFRARMEGRLEDFEIPIGTSTSDRYAFYELVAFAPRCHDREIFWMPAQRRFTCTSGQTHTRTFLTAVCPADVVQMRDYTLVRIPLADDAAFYALMPTGKGTLAEARADVSPLEIENLIASASVDARAEHSVRAVTMPLLDITTKTSFGSILRALKFPAKGLVHAVGSLPPRELVQICRFEFAASSTTSAARHERETTGKNVVLDRPFAFFVHHAPTGTIPVAGQFVGS